MIERENSIRFKSSVFATVYSLIMWSSTPFQNIANAHLSGEVAGRMSGDIISAVINLILHISSRFVSGQCLGDIRKKCRESINTTSQKVGLSAEHISLHHVQCCVLIEGLHMMDQHEIDGIQGYERIRGHANRVKDGPIIANDRIFQLVRDFLFRQSDSLVESNTISELITKRRDVIRPHVLFGLFIEGLMCLRKARQSKDEAMTVKWLAKAEGVLDYMKCWNKHSAWNFQNKVLLLEAERTSLLSNCDKAEILYLMSIQYAKKHRFCHEEAIASELAGSFFYERGYSEKACVLFQH